MIDFHCTMMGKKFYDRDVPNIAKALERIADALEKLEKKEETYDIPKS